MTNFTKFTIIFATTACMFFIEEKDIIAYVFVWLTAMTMMLGGFDASNPAGRGE